MKERSRWIRERERDRQIDKECGQLGRKRLVGWVGFMAYQLL